MHFEREGKGLTHRERNVFVGFSTIVRGGKREVLIS